MVVQLQYLDSDEDICGGLYLRLSEIESVRCQSKGFSPNSIITTKSSAQYLVPFSILELSENQLKDWFHPNLTKESPNHD